MGYDVQGHPVNLEREDALNDLQDDLYVGGYGIRSERETYDWMEATFDMRIIKVKLVDPYLYHLDCLVFPMTRENTLVCTELLEKDAVAEIEKVTNVIDVSVDDCYSGICNSVRLPKTVLHSSHIHDLKLGTEAYKRAAHKNRQLEDIAATFALEVSYFNLREFHQTRHLMSSMTMH